MSAGEGFGEPSILPTLVAALSDGSEPAQRLRYLMASITDDICAGQLSEAQGEYYRARVAFEVAALQGRSSDSQQQRFALEEAEALTLANSPRLAAEAEAGRG